MKKSSPTGMRVMAKENFISGEEICKIIQIAAKSGVTKMQFGPLALEFGNPPKKSAPGPAQPEVPENVSQEQQHEEEKALLNEELKTKEEQFSELWITNPLEAEKLLASEEVSKESGELDDGDDGAE